MNPAAHSSTRFVTCPICYYVIRRELVAGSVSHTTQPDTQPCAKPACQRAWRARIAAASEQALDAAVTRCPCRAGWRCEAHPDQPDDHPGCDQRGGVECGNPKCPWFGQPQLPDPETMIASTRRGH